MSQPQILIVEDEILIAHGLARILKKLGYGVIDIVASGQDAIAQALEHHPDLILMDVAIRGEINGIQAAQEILQQIEVPIIYMTAYSDEETQSKIKAAGGYGVLTKPYKKAQLKTVLETLFTAKT